MGLYGADRWCRIPLSDRYLVKATEVYYPPLSDRMIFTFRPDKSSTSVHYWVNVSSASSFFLNEYAQTSRVTSWMMVMKYRSPPQDFPHIGPHKSVCINYRGSRTISYWVDCVFCLLVVFSKVRLRRSGMYPSVHNLWSPACDICVNRLCHNHEFGISTTFSLPSGSITVSGYKLLYLTLWRMCRLPIDICHDGSFSVVLYS